MRSAQEVDYVLMHRLLSPIQSAVFILQARLAIPAGSTEQPEQRVG